MTTAPRLRADATIPKGVAVCEHYATLAYRLAAIEARRARNLATINAACDRAAAPVVAEMARLEQQLKPWWLTVGDSVTGGKRKSAELGGCMIGTKDRAATLAIAGDEAAIVARLKAQRWAKDYLRVTVAIDKVAVLKAIAAPNGHAQRLAEVGFSRTDPEPVFFVKRVAQAGTVSDGR